MRLPRDRLARLRAGARDVGGTDGARPEATRSAHSTVTRSCEEARCVPLEDAVPPLQVLVAFLWGACAFGEVGSCSRRTNSGDHPRGERFGGR